LQNGRIGPRRSVFEAEPELKTPAKLYKYHTANLARIEDAIHRVELHLRRAVASEDTKSQKALLPLYGLLIGASAETQLMKILYEPTVFSEAQKEEIIGTKTHIDRWRKLLEFAVRNHHKLNNKTAITVETIDATDFLILTELDGLLENDLKIIIELRNKPAHGQWEYPFTDDFSDVSSTKKKLLDDENLLTLKFKRSILKNLLFIIRDMAVSHRTLHRDFNVQHRRLKAAKRNLHNRSYEKYKNSLIEKATRGRAKELSNYKARFSAPSP
jgi:hypothetical protein